MQLNPYLHFNGQCEAAFQLYQRCLGGTIEAMLRYAGTPGEQHVSPDQRDKIMHARLVAGDAVLMGSDGGPERYELPKGFAVSIQVNDPAEAERIFNMLGCSFRHAQGPIRHTVDGQLRGRLFRKGAGVSDERGAGFSRHAQGRVRSGIGRQAR